MQNFTCGDAMRHVIAHEIHHIGPLSIRSRESVKKPVAANLILRARLKERCEEIDDFLFDSAWRAGLAYVQTA